jgi:hypothetical protein
MLDSSSAFDQSIQFLHVHIFRLLFHEPLSPSSLESTVLLTRLLTHEHSTELNKLGLTALHAISVSVGEEPEHVKVFFEEAIVHNLFSKYINI